MKQIYLAALLLLLISCKKDQTADPLAQLPDTTHVGANTLGCLVDGKPFVVSGKSSWNFPKGVGFTAYVNTAWTVGANMGGGHSIRIAFGANKTSGALGKYIVADNYPSGASYSHPTDGTAITGGNEFKTNAICTGELTLTYYNGVIGAGTFYFDAANDTGRVMHVTNGRFDISL